VQRLHNVEHRGIFPVPRAKKNKQAGAAFKELLEQKGFSNYKLAKAIGMGKDISVGLLAVKLLVLRQQRLKDSSSVGS
jgi:hypothetical protein